MMDFNLILFLVGFLLTAFGLYMKSREAAEIETPPADR
jgi:hypothetical protein